MQVSGTAKDQATKEKVILCCGNVDGVEHVSENISVKESAPASRYHTVEVRRHAVRDREAVLQRREQVPADLRGEQADAEASGQDLSGTVAADSGTALIRRVRARVVVAARAPIRHSPMRPMRTSSLPIGSVYRLPSEARSHSPLRASRTPCVNKLV